VTINAPTSALKDEAASVRRDGKSATAFRTISEVAGELKIPQHVLRFWETKFNHIKPLKRGGGRRYYRPEDIALLRRIRDLLYSDGYTIRGVQRLLRENGVRSVLQGTPPARSNTDNPRKPPDWEDALVPASAVVNPTGLTAEHRAELKSILNVLVEMRSLLAKGGS
jgi:DNA-binding transcriptional MerR regulator